MYFQNIVFEIMLKKTKAGLFLACTLGEINDDQKKGQSGNDFKLRWNGWNARFECYVL